MPFKNKKPQNFKKFNKKRDGKKPSFGDKPTRSKMESDEIETLIKKQNQDLDLSKVKSFADIPLSKNTLKGN